MRIHILGVAGTFMGGLAQLLKAQGHVVSGSDQAIYPPMSDQLAQAGIEVYAYGERGWLTEALDMVVIGNALSRGHEDVEAVLNRQLDYVSGPEILQRLVLKDRWVLAVAGTHGKTTTSSLLAWILEYAGLQPGFLIGGVPENFGVSARLGEAPFFVIEADEYDTAFFDKRSKFVHYRPRTCAINNLEYDHADIFPDISAIQCQFHQFIRTVPGNGQVIAPLHDKAVAEVLEMGVWTPVQDRAALCIEPLNAPCNHFKVIWQGMQVGEVHWDLTGQHNLDNAASALLAAHHAGVPMAVAVEALNGFKGVRRRQSLVGEVNGIRILEDFAHHPTAIRSTLAGLKAQASGRLLVVLEPRSNTMRMGVHAQALPEALSVADGVWIYLNAEWSWKIPAFSALKGTAGSYEKLLQQVKAAVKQGDTVVFMSNGAFGALPERLLAALKNPPEGG